MERPDKSAEILQAGLRVFERDGDSGTTLQSVAAEAGITKGGLRHYFRTRDALMTGILKTIDRPFETDLTRDGVRLAPDELLAAALRVRQRHPTRVALYLTILAGTIDPNHPAVNYFRRRFQRWQSTIADYVRDQQDLGAIPRHVDPEHAARSVLAAAEGIQSQWLVDRSIDTAAHVRRVWRDAIA